MSAFIKPLLALAISILVFAGYILLVDTNLLDLIQTRFYNPSIVNSYVKENDTDAELAQNAILELQNRFAAILREQSVRNSFLYTQSAEDIFERSRIFGILLEITKGLQSVQFIDNNGIRIHYSTSARDIISQSAESASYRNYNEDPNVLPYETVSVLDGGSAKFTMDEQSDRIILSYPFYDSMNVYRGTALFNVSIGMVAERLIAEGRLKISDNISIINEPAGILIGSPETSRADIHRKVSGLWSQNIQGRITLDSGDSGVSFSLITSRTGYGLYFGRLINDSLFSISDSMRLILQMSIFLTFYLTFFFLLNIKPNPLTVVENRIKNLRENLFEQLYIKSSSQDRTKWILELGQRREEIRKELKRHLKIRRSLEATIDGIIDKSWDELLAVLKSGSSYSFPVVQETIIAKKQIAPQQITDIEELEEIDEVESLEEIEKVEAIEEFNELEEIEDIEDIEEADEIEEIEFEYIKPARGLLELASEIEADIYSKVNIDKPIHVSRGLLELASEIEAGSKELDSPIHVSRGLLELASEIEARETKEAKPIAHKGLLAVASEIEFSHEYPVVAKEPEEEDFADLDINRVVR